MALAPGTRLGVYEITAQIGEGGMGQVYRATDTKLKRQVAIKILPPWLGADADRLARFQREAEVLASLNHPHIAAIYGLEDADGVTALVMELVEGEDLSQRIARGAIPLDEALPIAKQIAEAIEAAHEQGIIHRDLKPANIKVRPDGTVKVLDFGLAKAMDPPASSPNVSRSPTITTPAMTQAGMILGTAAYMSPEQARGKPVDKRADIWAFGCVLFEMLTGRHAFAGETITDILVSVMTKDPDWQELPPATPLRLRQLLTRSLRKDVRARLQHAGDARIEVIDILAEPSLTEEPQAVATRPRHTALMFALAFVATAALAGYVAWDIVRPGEAAVAAVTRVPFALPRDQRLVAPPGIEDASGPAVALSQDGSKLAYVASIAAGAPQLYLRELDAWEARPLPGTENAELPFFSPDGNWTGFLADGAVFKMPSSGGARVKIADLPLGARGAAWGPNETIILGGVNTGLFRLDAGGGEPRQITRPDSARGEQYHAWPDVLPGGTHVLFTAATHDSSSIGVLSLETGEWHILEQTDGAAQPRYLDSEHLVFFRAAGLFAMPFDLSTAEPAGSPVQVASDVFPGWNAGLGIGYFAVSRSGSLVYVPGGVAAGQNRLVLVDRQGREAGLPAEPGRYRYTPSVSPDGQRLAVSTNAPRISSDLWIHDLARGTRIRLTSQDANVYPVWTADGRRIIFSLFKSGAPSFDLYSIAADGSGKPEPLLVRDFDQSPTSSSRDGRFVAFDEDNPNTGSDIHVVSLEGDHTAVPFLATPADEQESSFSPDGRFVAYSSNESGRFEVYVQRFPGGGGKSAISSNGGRWPHWSPQGNELFYSQGSAMMAVIVDDESTFRAGTPRALFEGRYAEWYDVTIDGGRFVMITKEQATLTGLNFVLNWVEEVKRLVPTN